MKLHRLLSLVLSVPLISVSLMLQCAYAQRTILPKEPKPNLGQLKIDLTAYHDCTGTYKVKGRCYENEIDRQADRAISYLQKRTARRKANEKLALVLDIDETALSNWNELKTPGPGEPKKPAEDDDFAYIAADWNAWVAKKQATAIKGTLKLYIEAVRLGASVFFITSRPEDQKADTADNLKDVGYVDVDDRRLIMRGPHPKTQTVTDYKSGERQKIVDEGYHIILNVGDQRSDLNGKPQAERSIKLPNPFYYIP